MDKIHILSLFCVTQLHNIRKNFVIHFLFNKIRVSFMKKCNLICSIILLAFANTALFSQQLSFMSYRDLGIYQHTSPSGFRTGLYGFDNPALLSYNNTDGETMFAFTNPQLDGFNIKNWALFNQNGNFGSAMIRTEANGHTVYDYRFSLNLFKSQYSALGFSYGFVGGEKSYFKRSNSLGIGYLLRPNRYMSFSYYVNTALDKEETEQVLDVGFRPIPNYLVTFFGDYVWNSNNKFKNGNWSAGVNWEIIDGLRLTGRYFENKSFSLSLDLSFRYYGAGSINGISNDGKLSYNTNYIKLGGPDRSIIQDIFKRSQWVTLSLAGDLPYQSFKWFDERITLLDLLTNLDKVKNDKFAKGLLIDARKISAPSEKLWEIREKLAEIKKAGKPVIIFIENSSMAEYYFASVANKIILDPMGSVDIKGIASSRSYYKEMLDKLGIGFEEIRLFKYKSAAENMARDTMSEGEREQKQAIIDNFYNTIKQGIMAERKISDEQFERLVNDKIGYNASAAVKANLVDTLGRWENRDDLMAYITNSKETIKHNRFLNEKGLFSRKEVEPYDDKWGKDQSSIAVIYLEGACAMDEGINGRASAKALKAAAEDESIKAIVLRVDSPGGDGMASDYVAEMVRKYKDKKPIIVSQGSYAASGGYWLSMDGDKIITSPFTLTGSIGVISARAYDKGLQDSLNIHTAVIKRGKYSDLESSWMLPIIPIGLPIRNYTPEERKQIDETIMDYYKDFVTKVSVGRKMTYDEVHSLAQGRVWTGDDAKRNKLADEIGTLYSAIEAAKAEAKISKDEDVEIWEYPEQKLMDFKNLFMPKSLITEQANVNSKELRSLIFRLKSNGKPMHIIPADYEKILEDVK